VTADLRAVLRHDFVSFLLKAHGESLDDGYIPYLAHELARVARRETKRLIVNLPPRHLKTFASSICLPAFILGHDPSAKIMIVTYGENLAVEIAARVRGILRAPWYRAAFSTTISPDHARVSDFATTAGGGVYAVPIGGQLTGYGADFIIVDDPLEIKDAENIARIDFVNDRFDQVIRNRLNHPSRGAIVIVAHRLHETSVDPGQAEGDGNSFSVVQVWRVRPTGYFLADQWRGRESYDKLRTVCRRMIRRYQPCVALIEKTGTGIALLSDLQHFGRMERIPVVPHDSKVARLRSHITVIRDGKIALPESAEWRQDYVAEFVDFPKSKFSDQVDATTQFLEFIATNPVLKTLERSGMGALALNSRPQRTTNISGAAIALGSRRFR
jgi:predicted phage terminase large subunit-like protein